MRFLFLVFVAFHLVVLLVLPNGASYLARNIPGVFVDYANQLGMNTSWNFYSPDPAHPMYYQYTIYFDVEDKEPFVDFIPPQKEQIVTNSSDRRMLYAMRYLALDSNRLEGVLLPYLCRKFSNSSRIVIQHHVLLLPNLEKAQVNRTRPLKELIVTNTSTSRDYQCEAQRNEEMAL